MKSIKEYFEEVETTKEYDGYYYQVADIISIVVLGSLCGLKNPNQLHQWATNERTRGFLREVSRIMRKIVSRLWQNKISQQSRYPPG